MISPESRKYPCVVVDDKLADRLALLSYIRKYPFLQVTGVFALASEALAFIDKGSPPDAVFLDIDMPEITGLELRSRIMKIPACIFVSAHPEFALEGFEMAALDYILKPLNAERIEKAMLRLAEYLELHFKAEQLDFTVSDNTVVIREGFNQIKLQMQEILYLEALKDYTGIVTSKKKYCVLGPLGGLLKEKPFRHFVRIHRSYAIHRDAAKEKTPKGIFIHQTLLPVGRAYKDTVEKLFTA
jgi:two-component system, LytTR family, response regulator